MKTLSICVIGALVLVTACRRPALTDPPSDRDAVNAALERYRQAWLQGRHGRWRCRELSARRAGSSSGHADLDSRGRPRALHRRDGEVPHPLRSR